MRLEGSEKKTYLLYQCTLDSHAFCYSLFH